MLHKIVFNHDKEFLFEMMEINEDLDDATSIDQVNVIKSENEAAVEDLIEKISSLFDNEDFERALELLQHMKYRERLAKRVEQKIESF